MPSLGLTRSLVNLKAAGSFFIGRSNDSLWVLSRCLCSSHITYQLPVFLWSKLTVSSTSLGRCPEFSVICEAGMWVKWQTSSAHADVTPISDSRSRISPADFYDAENAQWMRYSFNRKWNFVTEGPRPYFYNRNICIWQWYWIITLKNITRVSFRKKKGVCEGCEERLETTAALHASFSNQSQYLASVLCNKNAEICCCFFWFHQRCLWGPILSLLLLNKHSEANTANAHSLVLHACSVCALTQTRSPQIHTAKNGQTCIQIMWQSEQAVGWEGMSFNGLQGKVKRAPSLGGFQISCSQLSEEETLHTKKSCQPFTLFWLFSQRC